MIACLRPFIYLSRLRGRDRPGHGGDLRLAHRHSRRLLLAAGILLSMLSCIALAITVASCVRARQQGHLHAFMRARASLDAHLRHHHDHYARLARLTAYAWQQGAQRDPALQAADLRRYFADGQTLQVQQGAGAATQLVVGRDTQRWPAGQLGRYLALARSMSLVSQLESDGAAAASVAYFLDPSGHVAVLDHGLQDSALARALSRADRDAPFGQLRAYVQSSLAGPDRGSVATPGPSRGDRRNRTGTAPHPISGRASRTTAFPVHDGTRAVGVLVAFEPVAALAGVLGQATADNLLVVGPDGEVILGSRAGAPADLLHALKDLRRWPRGGSGISEYLHAGWLGFAAPVAGTDGSLVSLLDGRELLAEARRELGIAVAVWALGMATIWILLAWLDRRVLAPAAHRSRQVHADEQLFRSLIQMTPAGLCLIDTEGAQPVVQNELMRRYAAAAERCGMDLYAALVEGYIRACRVGGEGDPAIAEFELSHPAVGRVAARHLLVSATQVVHEQRSVLLCVLQDLTARVELQAQKDLLHDQAECAHRARSRFLAAMSHEIRTPLHGILGHLELFARSRLDGEQRARLHRITQSADSLLLIISDVLDLERAEANQLGLEVVRFEPAVLIEGVALLYAPLALGKGVDLDLLVDPLLPSHCTGPMARIEQVLRNLVGNAIKFTPSGRIEIRLLPSAQPGALRWEVADSGIGLTERQQENLFEPFIQADDSIAGRFGGSGLGLSLCRQLCRLMGGDIDVHSTPGVGSVFGFDIPLLPAERPCDGGRGPLSGRRVLLHSTVTSWREELARRLRRWGAEVLVLDTLGQADKANDGGPLPLVLFERNQRATGPARHAGVERVVRVRSDGPLRAALREGVWQVSAYSAASLLEALLEPGRLEDGSVTLDGPMATPAAIG